MLMNQRDRLRFGNVRLCAQLIDTEGYFTGTNGVDLDALSARWYAHWLRDDPDGEQLMLALMAEITAVGQACGVALPDDLPAQRLKLIQSQDGRSIASMAVDLLRGNNLELPWLAGKVVELGRQHGVPTPIVHTLYTVIKPYINGRPEDSPAG